MSETNEFLIAMQEAANILTGDAAPAKSYSEMSPAEYDAHNREMGWADEMEGIDYAPKYDAEDNIFKMFNSSTRVLTMKYGKLSELRCAMRYTLGYNNNASYRRIKGRWCAYVQIDRSDLNMIENARGILKLQYERMLPIVQIQR